MSERFCSTNSPFALKAAALQLPLQYLRTQSVAPSLSDSYYSSLFGQNLVTRTAEGRKSSPNIISPNSPAANITNENNNEE